MPLLPLDLHTALQEEVKAAHRRQNPNPPDTTANRVAMHFATQHRPRLSEATVHRFFNCAAPTQPSANTLNVLARYAGFADLADFARHFEEQNAMHLHGERSQRLGRAYGLMQRLRGETGPVLAASLRAAADTIRTPAGQDDWVQAWVDLAHLPGYYGQLLDVYGVAVQSTEAQLFAGGLRYLKALLTDDPTECEAQARLLVALDPRASTPAFTRGRWAFARLMQRFADDPDDLSGAELDALRAQAPVPAVAAGAAARPAAYNYFPAGYHFLVAEALFLGRQWPALAAWLAETEAALARIGFGTAGNVFGEVLGAWQAVALHHTGQAAAAQARWQALRPSFEKPENRWLWDYYEVYWWLAEAILATRKADVAASKVRVTAFAKKYGMPFFERFARELI